MKYLPFISIWILQCVVSPAACELSCAANTYRDGLLQIDFYTGFSGRTWANAQAHAESLHGRLPTNQEMIDYAQFHGGFATHGWIATVSPTASGGKDFIYVDSGESHVEKHGYPSWGDDAGADHSWFTHYAVARDLDLCEVSTTVGSNRPGYENQPCMFPMSHGGNMYYSCADTIEPAYPHGWCMLSPSKVFVDAVSTWGHCKPVRQKCYDCTVTTGGNTRHHPEGSPCTFPWTANCSPQCVPPYSCHEISDSYYGGNGWCTPDTVGTGHNTFTYDNSGVSTWGVCALGKCLAKDDQTFCASCPIGTVSYEGSYKTCTQDNLVYDFGSLDLTGTSAEKLGIWTAYAETFGATVELNNWAEMSTGISGPYGSGIDGFVSIPLPTGYNRVQVQYRDIHRSNSGTYALNILLDDVLVDSHNCCDGQTMNIGTCCNYKTFETEYTPGQVLKICEDCVGQAWDGAINPDLKITLFNARTCDTMCFDSSITPVKVTFSLTFGGSVTAADLNEGRKQSIKIRIAKKLKVATGAVNIKDVRDARRRLLAVTMDVEISAETEEQAAEFSTMEADVVSATEEAMVDSGLDTTVTTASCNEGGFFSYWSIRKSICP